MCAPYPERAPGNGMLFVFNSSHYKICIYLIYVFQFNLLFSSLSNNSYSLLLQPGELYFILKYGLILEAKQKGNI